jgi:predicted nucleic acid-binding protein
MNRLLLDTSAYSGLLRGDDDIQRFIRRADALYLNPIVLGELRAGFGAGQRARKNEGHLRRFLGSPRVTVLNIDEETSERYALIMNSLWSAATPVPTNDIWIAASAMQHGLAVLTMDAHFQRIPQILTRHVPSRPTSR